MLNRFSLSTKVTLLLSLVVFVVVFAVTYLINTISTGIIVTDLKDRSTKAAHEIAKQLGEHPQLPITDDLEDSLQDALEINRSITEISVFRPTGSDMELAATSSRTNDIPVRAETRECIQTGKTVAKQVENGDERFWDIVAPIYFHKPKSNQQKLLGCVSVLSSLRQVEKITEKNRNVALMFAPGPILLLIALLNILFRFTIHKPVKKIQEAMAVAEAGNLDAEVTMESSDELGKIAASYNRMLRQIREATSERIELIDKINNFNVELKSQVEIATAELTHKNRELRELNDKLFKMQLELFQLERLAVAGQLTATFAHEVGTPLNLISGHVQLLIESFSDNEFILRKLMLIQSQIDRLSEIVRKLLDATRRPKLDLAPLNLNQLIQDVSTLIRPTLEMQHIVCKEQLDWQLSPIRADRKQLEQVLLNLINNSIDAMPDGGELLVETVKEEGNKVAVRVSDTGYGIEPNHIEKLFLPMFTTKDIGKGTGLGLTICSAIVKEHGGAIQVKSVREQGTTFTILLPCDVRAEQQELLVPTGAASVVEGTV